MFSKKRSSLRGVKWLCSILACMLVFIVLVYAYDTPGGIADWRYSRAIGYSGTLSIPMGETPEQAAQKFRSPVNLQVIHKESIDGGVLLFTKQNDQKDGTDLGIEFVRKTWLGWKWVYGGGYGISDTLDTAEAFNYMSMPKSKGIHGPFPIMFGQITAPTIKSIIITISGDDAGQYDAKIIDYRPEQRLWYVELPASSDAPYKLEALNDQDLVVASKTFDDPHDFGSVPMSK